MKFEDIIEDHFYKITTAVSVVFYDDSGREIFVRFEEGTEVLVLRTIASWGGCLCEFVSEGLDDKGRALIGSATLEPLHKCHTGEGVLKTTPAEDGNG